MLFPKRYRKKKKNHFVPRYTDLKTIIRLLFKAKYAEYYNIRYTKQKKTKKSCYKPRRISRY